MAKFIVILLIGLVLEAIGVIFLSSGLKDVDGVRQVTFGEIWRVAKSGVTNPKILVGVLFMAIFFSALLYLLSQRDVSLIWPLTALGFVITTFAAKVILHEQISTWRWAGVALIVIGAGLITYSEKIKEQKTISVPKIEQTR
jgi:drug/metabolite transporter (DMT)-like permease